MICEFCRELRFLKRREAGGSKRRIWYLDRGTTEFVFDSRCLSCRVLSPPPLPPSLPLVKGENKFDDEMLNERKKERERERQQGHPHMWDLCR